MEDILAIIVVVAGVALATLAIRFAIKKAKAAKIKAEEERKRQLEATRQWRQRMMNPTPEQKSDDIKRSLGITPQSNYQAVMSKPLSKKSPDKVYTPPPPTYSTTTARSTTSTSSSDDGFLDGMLTGYVINSALNALSHKSEESSSYSSSSSSSSSSWGFDDDDSRKSAASSFSSSDSSSSWDSSSSDSGPSSDW